MPRTILRVLGRFLLGGLAVGAAVLPARAASASSYLVIPPAPVAEASAAYRYANMTGTEALAELDKRKIPYKKADPIDGVVSPVRLTGKLHGVYIHSSIPESQRATSMYEVLDARLALALDDFAKILERHDIEEVVHYSLYRPNVPREDADVKDEPSHAAHAQAEAAPASAAANVGTGKTAIFTSAKAGALHPALPAGKPALAAFKPAHAALAKASKTAHATPAKPSSPKAAPSVSPAKSALPALPSKALPSLPAKGSGTPHGAKQKTPSLTDKPAPAPATPALATPALATPAKQAALAPHKAPASHHSATAQKMSMPVRARLATPHKLAAKALPPAPQKASAPGKPEAKAPVAAAAKVSVGTAAKTPVGTAAKNPPAAPVSRQTWAPPGTRHPAGLAIDVAMLKKRDGQWVSVARSFQGKIGAKTCGDGVRTADTPEGRELRSIVCEANDQSVFTYVLTPNFNAAHYDHFHMEVRPTVKWFMYQ